MSVAKILALSTCAMLLADAAKAQLKPPYLEYAAKFTCGQETQEIDDVVRGVYASSINIHNPQAQLAVTFVKKIVIANREDAEIGRFVVRRDILKPDQAARVDCLFIYKALQLAPATHVEGYVVIEVPLQGDNVQPLLDVTAKYTARPGNGSVSTESVVPIAGKSITN
jgi:hypothetical protein